jgi:CheY-like chemotaxis protein
MDRSNLSGLRVLVVEDEALISMFIEDTLTDLGCIAVGIASGFQDAMDKLSSVTFDVAILDVNLNGTHTYPLAECLKEKRVPFVFSTGYGSSGVPEAFRSVPILSKPFKDGDLRRALQSAFT